MSLKKCVVGVIGAYRDGKSWGEWNLSEIIATFSPTWDDRHVSLALGLEMLDRAICTDGDTIQEDLSVLCNKHYGRDFDGSWWNGEEQPLTPRSTCSYFGRTLTMIDGVQDLIKNNDYRGGLSWYAIHEDDNGDLYHCYFEQTIANKLAFKYQAALNSGDNDARQSVREAMAANKIERLPVPNAFETVCDWKNPRHVILIPCNGGDDVN